MISMTVAFWTIGTRLLWTFHTDQLSPLLAMFVVFISDESDYHQGSFTSITRAAPCFSSAWAFCNGKEATSSFLNGP